jgi:cobalt-zinc-cadmium efflux system outer membrane protein
VSSHSRPAVVACATAGLILAFAAPARGESRTHVAPESLIVARPVPQPSGVLTLDQTLALAAGHHPRLRGAAWRLRASTARRAGVGRMANPTASFDVENLGGDAGDDVYEVTATLGQTIELGGDRRARGDVAEAAERVAWSELSAEEREVLAEVAERYLRTWELQQRVHQLTEAERLAGRSIAAAAERFRAGAGPAVEQTRAEAVQAQRRSERIRAIAELSASRLRLAAVWGATEAHFDSLALAMPRRVGLPPATDLDSLLDAHPRQQSAAAGIGLEGARVREARAARTPDLDLSGGVRRLGAGDVTTFVFGASIPLPIWNAQHGSVDAAEAERQAAFARAREVALELRGSLRAAVEHYQAAQESYELVAGTLVPRSEEVVRQLTVGYRSGRFSSLEYLEGQRSLLEAELQSIDAAADSWRARLALERLLGRSVEELGRGGGQ